MKAALQKIMSLKVLRSSEIVILTTDCCFLEQIVDFCCGSNDFSCLMKEKLQKSGKASLFKNYDLFQPKVEYDIEWFAF